LDAAIERGKKYECPVLYHVFSVMKLNDKHLKRCSLKGLNLED